MISALAVCLESIRAVRRLSVASPLSRRNRLAVSALGRFVATVAVGLSLSTGAQALIVGNEPGFVPATTVNPASYQSECRAWQGSVCTGGWTEWTQGDPGWANVTLSGSTYVYLGDNWVLSALHVGTSTANFETGSFSPLQNHPIRNPPSALAGGQNLTGPTDLRLIKIDGDPGLPSLTIASQSPTFKSEVVMIGDSNGRQAQEIQWNGHKGYGSTGPQMRRWGTNHLENPGSFSSAFNQTLSATTGVTTINGRDIIAMVARYDQSSSNPSSNPFESHAVGGDSGGAVFHNYGTAENPQWRLAGILNAVLVYEGQSTSLALYGNATIFADLSYYNQAYNGSICDVMKTCGDYSIVGDINLDGVVDDHDVTAFVAGWGFDNGAAAGDYVSWTRGDLNRDGKVDVHDFLLLRSALNGQISGAVVATLFGDDVPFDLGSSNVPEPSTAVLVSMATAFLALAARRRRASRAF